MDQMLTKTTSKARVWTIVALLSVAIAGLAALTVLVISMMIQDREATDAFDSAAAEFSTTAAQRDAMVSQLVATRQSAVELYVDAQAAVDGIPLVLVGDPSLLRHLDSVTVSLFETGGMQRDEDSQVQLAPAEQLPPALLPATPESREDRHAAAQTLAVMTEALRGDIRDLESESALVVGAISEVDLALRDIAAAAFALGDSAPTRVSAAEKASYLDALAELELTDPHARPAHALRGYAESWRAMIKAQDASLRADAIAARTGVACQKIEPTYIRGTLIVNRSYPLPCNFGNGMTAETRAAWAKMSAAASAAGHTLRINNDYRTYESQRRMHSTWVSRMGKEAAELRYARPGHSEHQSGLAIDLDCGCADISLRPEGKWVANNGHKFGFIIRAPKGKTEITGFMYEPWHLRYIGVELATILFTEGLTVEEYFGVDARFRE